MLEHTRNHFFCRITGRVIDCDIECVYVNILGGSVHTVKENAEALVVATKETGLEVNADKTKYMIISIRMQDEVTV